MNHKFAFQICSHVFFGSEYIDSSTVGPFPPNEQQIWYRRFEASLGLCLKLLVAVKMASWKLCQSTLVKFEWMKWGSLGHQNNYPSISMSMSIFLISLYHMYIYIYISTFLQFVSLSINLSYSLSSINLLIINLFGVVELEQNHL